MFFRRKVGIRTLSLGQTETFQIGRDNAIRSLILRLAGSITISGGSSSGTPKDATPSQLITNVMLRREGKDVLWSLPLTYIYRLNHFLYGAAPAATSLANGNAQSNTAVSVTCRVPLENIRGIKPFDTLLQGQGLSSLELIVDVASAASAVIQGGDRTVAVGTTPFTLDVTSEEETGVGTFVFGDLLHTLVQNVQVTGAISNLLIKPMPNNTMYKGIMVVVEDGGLPSDAVLTNIILRQGQRNHLNISAAALKDLNKVDFGLESVPTGYYFIPLMPDGRLNQCLAVDGNSDFELELATAAPSGTCFAKVVAIQYRPPQVVEKK